MAARGGQQPARGGHLAEAARGGLQAAELPWWQRAQPTHGGQPMPTLRPPSSSARSTARPARATTNPASPQQCSPLFGGARPTSMR
eukprot:16440885-Heterocapsa_arctica.AAC.1